MDKFETINLAEAVTMSKHELDVEIGKRAKYLRDQFGMDRIDTANLISSLLNMGAAMNERLKEEKTKNNK